MKNKAPPQELVKRITQQESCPPNILLVAPDCIRRERIIKLILDKFNPSKSSESAPNNVDGRHLDSRQLDKIALQSNSYSLFTAQTFWIIRHADELDAAQAKRLAAIMADKPEQTIFIVTADKLPVSNPISKLFASLETVITLEALKGFELQRWIKKELGQTGIKNLDDQTLALLGTLSDEDPDQAARIVEQAALYVEGDTLRAEDLHALFPERVVPNEFEFVDLLARGDRRQVELHLQALIVSGKNGFLLLNLLARTFSNYIMVKHQLQRGRTAADVRQSLGMTPWVFNKYVDGSRKYSFTRLWAALQALIRADSKLKNKSLGTEAIFSELVSSLAA